MLKIQIKVRGHEGLYANMRGVHTVDERNYGPRNLVKAYDALQRYKDEYRRAWGNVGFQGAWLTLSDGRALYEGLLTVARDPKQTHAERLDDIEGCLMTPNEIAAFEAKMLEEPLFENRNA